MRKSQLACAASLQASIRGINDFFKGISLSLTQFPVEAAEAEAKPNKGKAKAKATRIMHFCRHNSVRK